jgi:hypothetical protein
LLNGCYKFLVTFLEGLAVQPHSRSETAKKEHFLSTTFGSFRHLAKLSGIHVPTPADFIKLWRCLLNRVHLETWSFGVGSGMMLSKVKQSSIYSC